MYRPPTSLGVTSVQPLRSEPPAFLVTCTRPSSVPAQIIPSASGDSASETTVPCVSASEPTVWIFSTSHVDRSSLMRSQRSPPFSSRKTQLPPRYRVVGFPAVENGDTRKGEFQLKR